MATVPGVLLIGDYHIQGGAVAPGLVVSSLGQYASQGMTDLRAHRVFPDNPATGAATAATLGWYPWFDTSAGDVTYVVASATATTVTVTPNPGWATNQWAGFRINNNNLSGFGWRNALIVVVSNTADTLTVASWTATPETGSGLWFNQGRFRDCHIVGAWRTFAEVLAAGVPTRGGASVQAANQGIACDPELMRQLHEHVYPVAPYFQLAKYGTTAPITGGWNVGGSDRVNFEAWFARVQAAWTALATGNTLRWDDIIIDLSQRDVNAWIATPGNIALFQSDIGEMVTYLRDLDPSLAGARVHLVNHDARLRNVDALGGTGLANSLQTAAVAEIADAYIVNLDGRDLRLRGTDSGTPVWSPGEDNELYASSVYVNEYPTAIRKSIQIAIAGTAPVTSGALPMFIELGDSITVGGVSTAYVDAIASPSITSGVRNYRQRIFNRTAAANEPYDLAYNSNTSGAMVSLGGAECSRLPELASRYPADGVVLVKRGSYSSALASSAAAYDAGAGTGGRWAKGYSEHWPELLADIQNSVQGVNVVEEKQASIEGFFVSLGTNDAAVVGGGALFASSLRGFCLDLWAMRTNLRGKRPPIIWRLPQVNGSTVKPAEVAAVRAALYAMAAEFEEFVVVDCDDLEISTDGVHETLAATLTRGVREAFAFDAVALPNCTRLA